MYKRQPYTGCAAGAPAVIVPVYHTEGLVAPSFAQIDMSIAVSYTQLDVYKRQFLFRYSGYPDGMDHTLY